MREDFDAGDETKVAESEKKNKIAREQELEDIKALLTTPEGTRFLRRIVREGRIFHSSFTGNSQTFFNEGWRAFALHFFTDITEAEPKKSLELLTESKGK
jgi:hypothetical protein